MGLLLWSSLFASDDLVVLLVVILLSSLLLFTKWKTQCVIQHAQDKLSLGFFQNSRYERAYVSSSVPVSNSDYQTEPPAPDLIMSLDNQSPAVATALKKLIDLIIRDFIAYWLVNITSDQEFEANVRNTLSHALATLCERAKTIHWTHFFVTHVIQTLTNLLRIYRLTEKELSKTDDYHTASPSERVSLLSDKLLRDYKLHAAVRSSSLYI